MTLTFSKASAVDMAQRYKSQFGHLNHHFQFMTIHKFAYAVYRNYLKQTGKTMQLLDDGAQKYHILNEIYKKRHHDTLTEDDFETLTNHIGLIYNLKLTREDLPNFNFQWPDIFDLTEDYHRYKRDHDLFDFDDMLLSAIKLLQKTPKLLEQSEALILTFKWMKHKIRLNSV
jgi:Superfamily I DNA and RNA helicases